MLTWSVVPDFGARLFVQIRCSGGQILPGRAAFTDHSEPPRTVPRGLRYSQRAIASLNALSEQHCRLALNTVQFCGPQVGQASGLARAKRAYARTVP
jgi:hypothetical protein